MFTMDTKFLSIKAAKCMWHLLFMSIYPFARWIKLISDMCLQESKYLDQHAHMHMLIYAFAIPCAITI